MKRSSIALSIGLFGCLLASVILAGEADSPAKNVVRDPPPDSGGGKSLAILIGVQEYSSLPKLKYCQADVQRLARALRDHCQFDTVVVMTEAAGERRYRPTLGNLARELRQRLLVANSGEYDRVLLYFSGHGFRDAENRLYFAPPDCDRKNLELTALPQAYLRQMLDGCTQVPVKLLVLDCCHSGEAKGSGVGADGEAMAAAFRTAKGLLTLSSCSADEASLEWDEKRSGLFTYWLCEGLQGAADRDRDGQIDVYELHRYVYGQVLKTATALGRDQTVVLRPSEDWKGIAVLGRGSRQPAADSPGGPDSRVSTAEPENRVSTAEPGGRASTAEPSQPDRVEPASLPAEEPAAATDDRPGAGPLLETAEQALERGDVVNAAAGFQRVLEECPGSREVPHALCGLGRVMMLKRAFEQADDLFTRVIEEHADSDAVAHARFGRADARRRLGRHEAALEDLHVLEELRGAEVLAPVAEHVRGLSLAGLGNHDEAAAVLTQLLDRNPGYPDRESVYADLAKIQSEAGVDADAGKTLRRSIEEFPENAGAAERSIQVGEHAEKAGDLPQAMQAYYAAALKAGRTELGENATLRLCWCYYHAEDFDRAMVTARYYRSTWPDGALAAEAELVIAECLFRREKFAEALALYDEVAGATKDKELAARALLSIGLIHRHQGDLDQAMGSFTRILRHYPSPQWQAPAAFHLGECFEESGDVNLARQHFAEVGQLAPDSELAGVARERIQRLMRRG
ncbi:MAG TPA: tetratricopeptide repeat protein [Thermoguttaceae bacterium]|nr:tetratricopeptide repeat protein [Thermoguttaceae bacterium]